ncbi:MAG: NAD-dependent epimerase/dehydratase family protein [Pseudomonadota bacterium]|nr:NAD-dependent epimerase/dehydratase family protein [Pseudomonadota bacterium]
MHSLVIGMGDTGQRVAQGLLALGHRVTGVRRSIHAVAGVQMLAQSVHQLDLSNIAPVDQVYVILAPDQSDAAGYQQTFLHSIEPLRQALSVHPVQRLYLISSTSVYAQDQGEWVDEQSPTEPERFNGSVLLQAERHWRALYADRLVVIRPSGIYSAHRRRLVRWLQSGRPVATQAWSNRIHIEDLAGFLVHLATLTQVEPCYIATDDQPCYLDHILAGLADQLHLHMVDRIEQPVSGKRLSNQQLKQSGYVLRYANWQAGYAGLTLGAIDV